MCAHILGLAHSRGIPYGGCLYQGNGLRGRVPGAKAIEPLSVLGQLAP